MLLSIVGGKMNIIYLAAGNANLGLPGVIYQDLIVKRDLPGDMLFVDLEDYDVIIATPPCNYYSKARGSNKPSKYALDTKHLLPYIIYKLILIGKPFIVENVRSSKIDEIILDTPGIWIYQYGRHTYWTNIPFNPKGINQVFDFNYGGKRLHSNTQGGENVNQVIKYWLSTI